MSPERHSDYFVELENVTLAYGHEIGRAHV